MPAAARRKEASLPRTYSYEKISVAHGGQYGTSGSRVFRSIPDFFLFFVSLAQSAPFAYVPNQGGATVSVIDTATDSVTETLTLSGTLLGVAVNKAGTKAYFAYSNSIDITVLNIPGNTRRQPSPPPAP